MSPRMLLDVSFFVFLHSLDIDLAERVRRGGCAVCGGPLHAAPYPRKLRGLPAGARRLFSKRMSFCCGSRECRARATPPSVVFFGRRLHPGAMVLLVSALAHGSSDRRLRRLQRMFDIDIDRRTLVRWQGFWRDAFPGTDGFRAQAGRFSPPLSRCGLVRDLLRRFAGSLRDRLVSALLFLSPLTTGSVALERARRCAGETRRGGVVIAC